MKEINLTTSEYKAIRPYRNIKTAPAFGNNTSKAVLECFNKYSALKEAEPKLKELVPELVPLFNVEQKDMHEFSVGTHILKSLFSLKTTPEFHILPPADKDIMVLTVLLHDIAKKGDKIKTGLSDAENLRILAIGGSTPEESIKILENFKNQNKSKERVTPDHLHPQNSAIAAQSILTRMGVHEQDKNLITKLIAHHIALGDVNLYKNNPEKKSVFTDRKNRLKTYFVSPKELELMYVFTIADLKGIRDKEPLVYDKKMEIRLRDTYQEIKKEFFPLSPV